MSHIACLSRLHRAESLVVLGRLDWQSLLHARVQSPPPFCLPRRRSLVHVCHEPPPPSLPPSPPSPFSPPPPGATHLLLYPLSSLCSLRIPSDPHTCAGLIASSSGRRTDVGQHQRSPHASSHWRQQTTPGGAGTCFTCPLHTIT
ncbi:unnamed protein product [Closterium sp. Naga37s-1]|nr:unnamed protein product [Closterium sp. Naga37s-1]